MYDYLTELHQISTENSEEQQLEQQQQQQDININDGSISVLNSPYDKPQEKVIHEEQIQQRHTNRSIFNCGCSRTISGDNIHQTKSRNREHHRICSLS
jgi:hypothetical protein